MANKGKNIIQCNHFLVEVDHSIDVPWEVANFPHDIPYGEKKAKMSLPRRTTPHSNHVSVHDSLHA
jgi:hypothetical protein